MKLPGLPTSDGLIPLAAKTTATTAEQSNPETGRPAALGAMASAVATPTAIHWPVAAMSEGGGVGPDGPSGPAVTLSVAMIVKNEAAVLGPLLASAAAFADEIIVMDTGSTDATKEVALAAGAQVHEFAWCDDFAAARNAAFAACTKQWIMWIDADDKIPEQTIKNIKRLKRELATEQFTHIRTVFCPYHYEYTDTGDLCVNLNRERLLKNGIGHKWIGRIHETIAEPWQNSIRIEDIVIEHRPTQNHQDRKQGRNLRIFEQYIDVETCVLRELFLYGSELLQNKLLEESIAAFKVYLRRSGERLDPVGELYAVYTKLADALYQNKQLEDGIGIALRGIATDPSRAECYCVAGVLFMFAGMATAAVPLLAAAAVCSLPPPHISLVVHKLYSDVPMQCLVQVAKDLLKTTAPLERIYQIGSTLHKIAAELEPLIEKDRASTTPNVPAAIAGRSI